MWWMYAVLSALFASLTTILAKLGLKNLDSDLATAIRTAVIMLITWSVVFYKGNISVISSVPRSGWVFLALSGIATGLSWLFYFKALQMGKVAQVASVDKLSLALTILLSVIFLHESLSVKTLIGSILIVSGVLTIIN